MQDNTLANSDSIDMFFAVVFPLVDAFDRERIPERFDRLLEGHAVVTQIGCGLSVTPFKRFIIHMVRGASNFFQESRAGDGLR
jgi:hypothetical protein